MEVPGFLFFGRSTRETPVRGCFYYRWILAYGTFTKEGFYWRDISDISSFSQRRLLLKRKFDYRGSLIFLPKIPKNLINFY
jgi:hypothetical protein